ncbi:MAG: anti-sigma F factor [Clostridia bacterium]|nr:anti-sigma F factor [Clostridia bacterium]
MNNSMKIEFLSISKNESFARSVISAFVSQLNPTLEEIEDIKTAVSEAVTNIVVHAYGDKTGTVYITCELCDDTAVITIKDTGCGIENIDLARTPLYTASSDSERSGLGFTVMETFMDELTVTSKKNVGTTVTLTKRIGNQKEV